MFEEVRNLGGAAAGQRVHDAQFAGNVREAPGPHGIGRQRAVTGIERGHDIRIRKGFAADVEREGDQRVELVLAERAQHLFGDLLLELGQVMVAQDERCIARSDLQAGAGGGGVAIADQPAAAGQTRCPRAKALEALDELDTLC